jgi:dihydrolipoamide dehydrogenase
MIYDLITLGGGPAGYLAAVRAAQAGMHALCIEARSLGGVCLNEGCIPTKTLLNSAKIYDHATHGKVYGVTAENVKIDHAAVVSRKDRIVGLLVGGIKATLNAYGVTVIHENGIITSRTSNGYIVKAGSEEYTCRYLLIATGSSPVVPRIAGMANGLVSGMVMTSREILNLKEAPRSLAVIGGGVVGLEIASYFNSVGTEVTVIEMLNHIAGENDLDLVSILQRNYERKGMKFLLSAEVTEIEKNGVHYMQNGFKVFIPAARVLLSIGRQANTRDIGLEAIGVATEHGAIITNAQMGTNLPNVFAAGDVNGKSMLAHTAYREAEVAVNNMQGKKDYMRYDDIPGVIYTNPELGTVGETEYTARRKGLDVDVVKTPMLYSGRYVVENEGGDGIMKLVIDRERKTIIGAQVLCNYASEFIVVVAGYIEQGLTVDNIKKIVFPHPTVCEIIREAVFQYQ